MKATKYLSLAALALMGTLASCQSDDEAAASFARPDNAVGVNFSVGSLQGTTRSNAAATDDTQRQFNQGDQISVSTNDQEAVLFQCTSTDDQTWTEAVAGKFLLWTQPMLTFSAYYPVTDGTSMTAFTLPADQSTEANIALADYMTRQQNISRPEGGSDIQMQLERKMARVIVRINGFNDQYFNNQKTVSNVRIYSEASGIENGNPTGSSSEIQPYAQGNGGQGSTYTALVVPGYGDSGADFITLTDGASNNLSVKGIPELNAGNSYTFNLVVGKNRIEVASVTVQDWTTGETLAGGQATEQAGPTYTLLSAATTADYGKVVCADGHLHDAKTAVPAGCTAVGILGKVTATGQGLILALKNATSQTWNTINGWTSETTYAGTTLKVLPDDAARGTNLTSYTTLGETTVSNWAVAQKSDYAEIFTNLGSTKNNRGMTYDNNVNAYITTGVGGTAMAGTYWSATQDDDYDAWYFEESYWYDDYNTSTYYVRPVLGFGGQATEESGASTPTLDLTSPAVGQVIGSDGKNYAYGSLPTGVTAVAKICYVSGSNGLALALTDEGKMEWSTAIETCAAHTAPFTGGTWKLATQDEWDNMIYAAGSYIALHDGFSSVGGTNMQSDYYWSSTEKDSNFAWYYDDLDLEDWDSGDKEYELYVRACLAF